MKIKTWLYTAIVAAMLFAFVGCDSPTGGTPFHPSDSAVTLSKNTWARPGMTTSDGMGNWETWQRFTATAVSHYIHIHSTSAEVLAGQVEIALYGRNLNRIMGGSTGVWLADNLSIGSTYFIRIAGSAGISFGGFQIRFSDSDIPGIQLSSAVWVEFEPVDASITQWQWLTFTASSSTQYIHMRTLDDFSIRKYIQLHNCDFSPIGDEFLFETWDSDGFIQFTLLSSGSRYHIRVRSGRGRSNVIMTIRNSAATPSGVDQATLLSFDVWESGYTSISSGGEQWFRFTATATGKYINFIPITPNILPFSSWSIDVYSNGTRHMRGFFSSNSDVYRYLTIGNTYYIRVHGLGVLGLFNIRISDTRITVPDIGGGVRPPGSINARLLHTPNFLDINALANPASENWYTFRATSSTQFIHVVFIFLQTLNVQVYNSNFVPVGTQASLSGPLAGYGAHQVFGFTIGNTYYIRVWSPHAAPGTTNSYRIGFRNTSPF